MRAPQTMREAYLPLERTPPVIGSATLTAAESTSITTSRGPRRRGAKRLLPWPASSEAESLRASSTFRPNVLPDLFAHRADYNAKRVVAPRISRLSCSLATPLEAVARADRCRPSAVLPALGAFKPVRTAVTSVLQLRSLAVHRLGALALPDPRGLGILVCDCRGGAPSTLRQRRFTASVKSAVA